MYNRAWQVFTKYLQLYDKELCDIKEVTIMEFIAFLSLGPLAQSTIALYVSGVRHHLRLRSLPTYEDNFMLKLVLKGIANTHASINVRLPIMLDLLHHMIAALNLVVENYYDTCLYTAVLTAGFFGLLRPGEMAKSEHALLVQNVYFAQDKVVCFLPTSKTNKGPIPQTVHLHKQPNLMCPVSAMINYSKIRALKAGQYFIKEDGASIANSDLASILHHLAQFLGLPHHHFKPHSLHIGGSTHLHLSRVPVHKIKEIGCWSSDVFKHYIHSGSTCSHQEDLVYWGQTYGESL